MGDAMEYPIKEHKCIICGKHFMSKCRNPKYCDICRYEQVKARNKRYQKILRNRKRKTQTIYVCKVCKRTILAHGVVSNRKICDDCFANNPMYKYKAMYRKNVIEDVIESA